MVPDFKGISFLLCNFKKEGSLYKCTAWWVNPKQLNGVGYFADTSLSKPRGLMINYYQNGKTQDSSWYDDYSQLIFDYHYYPSGKLLADHFFASPGQEIIKGYDEEGKEIKDFIYAKEAEFPDGPVAWQRFISKNVNTQVPVKNGAPNGTYKVMILFVVDKNGDIIDLRPETNFGYGMEEEAMRVIRNSPRWDPLISLGKAMNAYRRQPVTFVVSGK